jgi:hypothetical protein
VPELSIDLREGFYHLPVVVRLDGREVFRSQSLSTRMQTGLAGQVRLEVGADPVEIEIELPSLNRKITHRVKTDRSWFVGIDLDSDGTPRLREGSEPFGYV